MTTKGIIDLLKERETHFLKTKSFSKLPGIYAFFFIGTDFPLLEDAVKRHQIIYIGKTESSQEKRNAKTHFTTGKTGSSTVRKSIGSLLCSQERLKPIHRNDSDHENGRFSHFKFDLKSEEIISEWMKNNLALSFYEYPANKQLIEKLETEIIRELKPVLNIDYKNPNNPYTMQIKQLRKSCAAIALKQSGFKDSNALIEERIKPKSRIKEFETSSKGTIYIDNITNSDVKSRKIRITAGNKHLFPSEKIGNPNSYSLDFKIGGKSFVAKYTIGSKDGKSRSGILKFGYDIYQETIKIQMGTNLKISKLIGREYIVERL
jgi:hypothetical protein